MIVSFVVPSKQDWRVPDCVTKLRAFANRQGIPLEVLVCGELAEGRSVPGASFLEVRPPLKGNCVRAGVAASTGDIIIVCDADLPVSHDDLVSLIGKLEIHEVAVGHRWMRPSTFAQDRPKVRRWASCVFRVLVGCLFGLRGCDTQCGVKAFTAAAARLIFSHTWTSGLTYDVEVLITAHRLGLSICEVPVHWSHEETTIRLWHDAPKALAELLWLRLVSP